VRVFAYCTKQARGAVAAATGVEPVTSPPITARTFNPQWLEERDFLYFRLHGALGRVGWFNDAGELALTRIQVDVVDLRGVVVVVGNCYGADDPMIEAFYRAGARAVIAGAGLNVAAGNRVVGVDLLVKWLIRGMMMWGWGCTGMRRALALAKVRLALTGWRTSDRDARAFNIIKKKGKKDAEVA